ncbi:Cupredoxin [Chytriomyces sp. MP71]|nr:Cupredoxin [Chytriomyces sp. MP71]
MLAWYKNSTANPGGNEPVWDTGVMNGIGQLDCSKVDSSIRCEKKTPHTVTVVPGSTNRLRVVNAGTFAAFMFWIDGHNMTVIEVDGVNVQPYTVSVMTLNVAQRYSILINANAPKGNYFIHANSYHMDPWISLDPATLNQSVKDFTPEVKGILNYKGVNPSDPPSSGHGQPTKGMNLVDTNLKPIDAPHCPYQATNVQAFLFEFKFDSRDGDTYQKAYPVVRSLRNSTWNTLVNSSYVPPVHDPVLLGLHSKGSHYTSARTTDNVIFIQTNQVIDIVIRNDDGGEHPFHIHGHNFWVMAVGVTNSLTHIPRTYTDSNPLLRDVVTVPACPHDDNGCLAADATHFDGYTGPLSSVTGGLPRGDIEDAWFGYAVIRFIADNPGAWIFHCHIAWHLAVGLSVTLVEGAERVPALVQGVQVQQTCVDMQKYWNGEIEA